MFPLVGVVHPMKTIKSLVVGSTTYLTGSPCRVGEAWCGSGSIEVGHAAGRMRSWLKTWKASWRFGILVES
jgi:hypothetical protein